MKLSRSDKWPITITLLVGAIALTIPLLMIGGVLYLYFSYVSILDNASEMGPRPTQQVETKEAR